ncbi:hypothetical protein PFISCL1PPCAC_10144, partial [Pristionchus fissidentatus]
SLSHLLSRLEILTNLPLDDDQLQHQKAHLKYHPMHTAMFSVLVEVKGRTEIQIQEEDEKDPQQLRLDNMLLAEGVTGPEKFETPSEVSQSLDQTDYKVQLHNIRNEFQTTMRLREDENNRFLSHVSDAMKSQSTLRPISEKEVNRVVGFVKKKIEYYQIQFKQQTCENLMLLKSRYLDARRKRRNFSKAATEILTQYFNANIASPYPSEEVKEELARKCNISTSQVSNWFGNKRIRFKKNIAKAQSDKEMQENRATQEMAMQAAAAAAAQSMPMMIPPPFFNDPSLMGQFPMPPFYFPQYDPNNPMAAFPHQQ